MGGSGTKSIAHRSPIPWWQAKLKVTRNSSHQIRVKYARSIIVLQHRPSWAPSRQCLLCRNRQCTWTGKVSEALQKRNSNTNSNSGLEEKPGIKFRIGLLLGGHQPERGGSLAWPHLQGLHGWQCFKASSFVDLTRDGTSGYLQGSTPEGRGTARSQNAEHFQDLWNHTSLWYISS